MKHIVKIIFGKDGITKIFNNEHLTTDELNINFKEFIFKTEKEKNAFCKGLDAAVGWTDYYVLEENEAKSVKAKIKSGDVIGLDNVIVATQPEFDNLIQQLKEFELQEPPTVKVIESNQIVTFEKVELIR